MDARAQRRELRQQLAERRRALSPAARMAAAQGLRRRLEQLPEYFTDPHVAGYWASRGELPLNLVIPPLAARGQQFLLPVVTADRQLRVRAVASRRRGAAQPLRHPGTACAGELAGARAGGTGVGAAAWVRPPRPPPGLRRRLLRPQLRVSRWAGAPDRTAAGRHRLCVSGTAADRRRRRGTSRSTSSPPSTS